MIVNNLERMVEEAVEAVVVVIVLATTVVKLDT